MTTGKVKATREYIESVYERIISVGYCDLQFLLHFEKPMWYTTREEGWAADVYDFGTTAIVTGYEPFGEEADYDKCKTFDEEAYQIIKGNNPTTNTAWRKVKALLEQFLDDDKTPDIVPEYLKEAEELYEKYIADDTAAKQMADDPCVDMRDYETFCLARELCEVRNEYPFIVEVLDKLS